MADQKKLEKIRDMVYKAVLSNQSAVVEKLLECDDELQDQLWEIIDDLRQQIMDEQDPEDPEYHDPDEIDIEVYEWWLVEPALGRKLEEHGEIVLRGYNCTWWGRQCTGQAIYMDSVMEEIYDEWYES